MSFPHRCIWSLLRQGRGGKGPQVTLLGEVDCGPGRGGYQSYWARDCGWSLSPQCHTESPLCGSCGPRSPFQHSILGNPAGAGCRGVTSRAWLLYEKHLLFLVRVSSFAGVWRTGSTAAGRLSGLSLHLTLCWSVPSLPFSPQPGDPPRDSGVTCSRGQASPEPSLEEGGLEPSLQ